jgi:hypothetical protein
VDDCCKFIQTITMSIEVEINFHGNTCTKIFTNHDTIETIKDKIRSLAAIHCIKGHSKLLILISNDNFMDEYYYYLYEKSENQTEQMWILTRILHAFARSETTFEIFDDLIKKMDEIKSEL